MSSLGREFLVEKETAFVAIPQRGKRKKEAHLYEIKIRFLGSHKEFPCMSLSQAKFNILRDYLWFPLQTGMNIGASSLSFLQGIFPNQGSNLGLLHCM